MEGLKSYWSQKASTYLVAAKYSMLFCEQLCLTLSGLAPSSYSLGSHTQFSSWEEGGGGEDMKAFVRKQSGMLHTCI